MRPCAAAAAARIYYGPPPARSQSLSRHPVDRLIRSIIHSGRAATPDEVERVATAPFDQQLVRVPVDERGAMYQGYVLGARADALTYHVIKRVVIEPQWVHGTTAMQYVHDLRQAVRAPSARLMVYARRGGNLAATITPTETVVPAERRGAETLPHLLVIYAADRGTIITGYQFSKLEMTGVPEELRWLN